MAIEMAILQRYKHNITRDMISNNLFSTFIFYKCFFFFFVLHCMIVTCVSCKMKQENKIIK